MSQYCTPFYTRNNLLHFPSCWACWRETAQQAWTFTSGKQCSLVKKTGRFCSMSTEIWCTTSGTSHNTQTVHISSTNSWDLKHIVIAGTQDVKCHSGGNVKHRLLNQQLGSWWWKKCLHISVQSLCNSMLMQHDIKMPIMLLRLQSSCSDSLLLWGACLYGNW